MPFPLPGALLFALLAAHLRAASACHAKRGAHGLERVLSETRLLVECHNPKNPGSDADANSLNLKRVKGLAQRRSLAFEQGVFTGEEEDELVEALCSRCI